jgi:hypothetical protein
MGEEELIMPFVGRRTDGGIYNTGRISMKKLLFVCLAACGLFVSVEAGNALAECRVLSADPTYSAGQLKDLTCGTNGLLKSTLGTLLSGEDQAATTGGSATGVLVTEQRYLLSATVSADAQILAGAGFAKDITCIGTDAAATAGTIILYDKLTEAAPAIWTWNVAAAAVLTPITFPIDFVASTGLYLGFTTTADVACYVRYR